MIGTLSSGRRIDEEDKDNEDDFERDQDNSQVVEYRTILPALKPPDQKVSIWKVIKDAVGKDLSKFCVPVYFNEPISMLQKVAEIMDYENLLERAVQPDMAKHPIKRLLHVTAFGIA